MKEYVEKAAVISIIKTAGFWEKEDSEVAITCVEQTKSADVGEVRHGYWINIGDYDMAECSECGEVFDVADQYAEPTKQDFKEFCRSYRYCPSCGCRMDLKERKEATP